MKASLVLTFVGIFVALLFLGWALGWIATPFEVFSVQNVREQWKFAYNYEEDLEAAARQVCIAQRAYDGATDVNIKSQRQSQLIAREDNYARIAGDYNAALRNAFEAGLVRPPDVREEAPALAQMISQLKATENLDCGSR